MSDENISPDTRYKSTPPTNKKVRNPFDKGLIERLHKPICSPGMCKIYKKQNKDGFCWDINQACILVPVDIVACNSQFEPSPDPALEKIAEEATERFFSQEMAMPSPLESSKKVKPIIETTTNIVEVTKIEEKSVITNDVSVQTVLTLPPVLPPEIEKILQSFCTYTQEQNISGDYEITANGSLRRKLFYEETSEIEHNDSELTDDEIQMDLNPSSHYKAHTPVIFSPELTKELIGHGMKRTFGTPLNKNRAGKLCNRNKLLESVDFGEPSFSPIGFHTPNQKVDRLATPSSSLASSSISPLTKVTPSDDEKNTFTSPEMETKPCQECEPRQTRVDKPCLCDTTPSKFKLNRSSSLKESPPKSRRTSFSFSQKRSLSMSSLHRSRSVQKLDFSMDMSLDGSIHDNSRVTSETSLSQNERPICSIVDDISIKNLVKAETIRKSNDCTNFDSVNVTMLDSTPLKVKRKSKVLSHEITKIRTQGTISPVNMSLDTSLDSENPLSLEDKKIDFNTVDLNFLTETSSRFSYTSVKNVGDSSTCLKKVDSGYNENTFYVNASGYYESAIKPSELTVTNISKSNSKTALKEISNLHWMKFDSGYKDENSGDSLQFYTNEENSLRKPSFLYSDIPEEGKENRASGNFEKLFMRSNNKNEDIASMSDVDVFSEDITFNCNFSSTPSKNKRKVHS